MNGPEKLRQREVAILDSINEGVFTVDLNWRVTAFNKAAERITGVSRELAISRPCCEVFRANICETHCVLRRTMTTGLPVVNATAYCQPARPARAHPNLYRPVDG